MTHGNPQNGPGPYGYGPLGPQGYPQQQPKKKKSKLKWVVIIVGLLFVLGMCAVATSDNDSGESTDARSTDSSSVQGSNPEPEQQEPEQQEPDVPREFTNALKSAQSYVDLMPFSYQGLYDQLTSEYADNYPAEAAQYAVDNVEADWNAEAVEAAESYLETMPFSREELIGQLTSDYADKFTVEQATAAVNQVY